MRGKQPVQVSALAFIDPESRIPADHPARTIRHFADQALAQRSPEFDRLYGERGRLSIPPERLLKASLLMALYSVRSERAFCEQLDYNWLFRWFLQMDLVEPSFDHSSFSKNCSRPLEHRIAQQFFDEVVAYARGLHLLSSEHFSVDGTLIEANASLKSFKLRVPDPDPDPAPDPDRAAPPAAERQAPAPVDDPGNPSVDFHGEKRSNATHQSTTAPEARLKKKGKGKEAKLVFEGHGLMENRNGFLADLLITQASGTAEQDAVPVLLRQALERGFRPQTLGADKGYDTQECVADMRALGVTPHVAQNQTAKHPSAIDAWTTRHRAMPSASASVNGSKRSGAGPRVWAGYGAAGSGE